MNKLMLSGILLLAFGCAKKSPQLISPSQRGPASTPAVDAKLKKEKFWNLTGYWRQRGGSGVIFFESEYKNEDSGVETKVRGLDLRQFGYTALPIADDDAVALEQNEDRGIVEGLFQKKVAGKPFLFEFTFANLNVDTLQVKIQTQTKTTTQVFERAVDQERAAVRGGPRAALNRLLFQQN